MSGRVGAGPPTLTCGQKHVARGAGYYLLNQSLSNCSRNVLGNAVSYSLRDHPSDPS